MPPDSTKCSLCERMHLSPRPSISMYSALATNRENRACGHVPQGSQDPLSWVTSVKKEDRKPVIHHLSVSSISSANRGSSDWDNSGAFGFVFTLFSVYADTYTHHSFTLFFLLAVAPYPNPRGPNSQSPPVESPGICLQPCGFCTEGFQHNGGITSKGRYDELAMVWRSGGYSKTRCRCLARGNWLSSRQRLDQKAESLRGRPDNVKSSSIHCESLRGKPSVLLNNSFDPFDFEPRHQHQP